jgi:uncharacterized membrane protein
MSAIICAAVGTTAIFLAVELHSSYSAARESLPSTLTIYCLSFAMACSPYFVLQQVVRIERRLLLAIVEFVAVILPAPVLFFTWRHSEGFSFLAIPLQLILALIFLTISLILDSRAQSNRATRP